MEDQALAVAAPPMCETCSPQQYADGDDAEAQQSRVSSSALLPTQVSAQKALGIQKKLFVIPKLS